MDDFDFDESDERELHVTRVRHRVEEMILNEIRGHERSAQRKIGPSGLGTPCPSQLAYMLTSPNTMEDPRDQWRQTVGVAVHDKLERAVKKAPGYGVSVFAERKVSVGEIYLPGQGMVEIEGTCDAYIDGVILDWKIPGLTNLRKYRKQDDPGKSYMYQSHLYGRGYIRAGLPVTDVAVFMLPNSGEWRDRYWWSEPYSEAKALKALERASKYGKAIEEFGLEAVLEATPRIENYCHRCPFALPSNHWPQCPTAGDPEELKDKHFRSVGDGPVGPATTLGEAIRRAR